MPSTLLLKAGRVFDGVSDAPLENGYVSIENRHIAAVGPQSELNGAEERFEQVVELGPEATLLPGLINMHVHMTFSAGESILHDHEAESHETRLVRAVENMKTALRTGVTTVRDCGTLNEIAFSVRHAIEHGIMTGPRVVAAGAGLTTTGGHCWFCGVEADDELSLRRAVRAQHKAGADFIKVFATGGNSTPGTNPIAAQYNQAEMCAVTEEAGRLGLRVASHAHGTPGVHHSIAARVTTVEHCSFLTPRGMAYEAEQARIMAGEGIFVCPTIFQGIGKLLPADPEQMTQRMQDFVTMRQARFELVNKLVDAGVRIVSGSDAGVAFNEFADYPGDLVLTARGTGLDPLFVLRSATSVAAEALGRPELGVLAPGKAADVLAVRGNPLERLEALLDPCMVVARGEAVA